MLEQEFVPRRDLKKPNGWMITYHMNSIKVLPQFECAQLLVCFHFSLNFLQCLRGLCLNPALTDIQLHKLYSFSLKMRQEDLKKNSVCRDARQAQDYNNPLADSMHCQLSLSHDYRVLVHLVDNISDNALSMTRLINQANADTQVRSMSHPPRSFRPIQVLIELFQSCDHRGKSWPQVGSVHADRQGGMQVPGSARPP